jgi:hypothetical protein
MLVLLCQRIGNDEDPRAIEISPGKPCPLGLYDIPIAPQETRKREITPGHRMKVVVSFIDHDNRAGSFVKGRSRYIWAERRISDLLSVCRIRENNGYHPEGKDGRYTNA